MSSQCFSMQLSLGRPITDLARIPRRPSSTPPLRIRTRSVPCHFNCCIAVLANPTAPTRTAEELQEAYGCQGLTFVDSGGTTVADLKLENGCKARLVLPTAQITSYKAHMWHGGQEELLHAVRRPPGRRKLTAADSPRGGINLRFFHSEDPSRCILSPSPGASWNVEDVRCEAANYAQVQDRPSLRPILLF